VTTWQCVHNSFPCSYLTITSIWFPTKRTTALTTTPIIGPETLHALFRDCYSGVATESFNPIVSVQATVGITYRLRAMGAFATEDDTAHVERYLSKCFGRVGARSLGEPSLRLAQALLAISVLLQASDRSQRAGIFVSLAVHKAQELTSHDAPSEMEDKVNHTVRGDLRFFDRLLHDTYIEYGRITTGQTTTR